MEKREFHLQPLGICYRLYHFITKTLASQALKTVTLGRSTRYGSTATPCEDDSISSPAQKANDTRNPCMNIGENEMAGENTATLPKASLPQTKSLRKVVSINDSVEEILPIKKKKKRSKSFKKSSSMDQEEEKEEEPKPLRSILKVGSDLKDQSNSIC